MARGRLAFNHAIIYVRDVRASLAFYRDLLGFQPIEADGQYARLRSPRGPTTIALHGSKDPRAPARTRRVALYFETPELGPFCRRLVRHGVRFDQLPKRMPWGWTHAYLHDPDGHTVSLYWAGRKRLQPTP